MLASSLLAFRHLHARRMLTSTFLGYGHLHLLLEDHSHPNLRVMLRSVLPLLWMVRYVLKFVLSLTLYLL